MLDYHLRTADRDDVDAVLDILYEYSGGLGDYDERYLHREDAGEQWSQFFLEHLYESDDTIVIVADSEEIDGLIGVIELRVMDPHPILRLGRHGKIFGHHVREEYQKNGVEGALLAEAERWFANQGVDSFRVETLTDNEYIQGVYEEYDMEIIQLTYERRL